MPLFIASLLGGLVSVAGSLVGRVLIALGVSYVTFTGLSTATTALENLVWSNLSGASATVLNVMGILQVDNDINIIFSAFASRMVLKGLTSGSITKMVLKS